jgi:hypothetical protein
MGLRYQAWRAWTLKRRTPIFAFIIVMLTIAAVTGIAQGEAPWRIAVTIASAVMIAFALWRRRPRPA